MSRQDRIYLTARDNIGETAWSKNKARQAKRDKNVYFKKGEYKCNLFVYEVVKAGGYDVGTPNQLNGFLHPFLAVKGQLDRPPCAIDWYNKKVDGMEFIGENNEGRYRSRPGDIITDGTHMGIIGENNQTISAS